MKVHVFTPRFKTLHFAIIQEPLECKEEEVRMTTDWSGVMLNNFPASLLSSPVYGLF